MYSGRRKVRLVFSPSVLRAETTGRRDHVLDRRFNERPRGMTEDSKKGFPRPRGKLPLLENRSPDPTDLDGENGEERKHGPKAAMPLLVCIMLLITAAPPKLLAGTRCVWIAANNIAEPLEPDSRETRADPQRDAQKKRHQQKKSTGQGKTTKEEETKTARERGREDTALVRTTDPRRRKNRPIKIRYVDPTAHRFRADQRGAAPWAAIEVP